MRKLRVVFVIMFILSVILCSTNYAYTKEEFKPIIEEGFTINSGKVLVSHDGGMSVTQENIFNEAQNTSSNRKETNWNYEFGLNVLAYDKLLYQIIPLDYKKSKEIIEMERNAQEQFYEKKEHIREQEILARRENSNVTIADVNRLIDTYNQEFTNEMQRIKSKLPSYDENSWKELEGRKITYSDPTGNTAYILLYVKATYSKFMGDKTVYANQLYDMNYNYLSKNQLQGQQEEQQTKTENSSAEQQTQEQKPSTEQQKQSQEKQTSQQKQTTVEQKQDPTTASTILPKAGLKYGIILIIILIAIGSGFFYKKHNYWKGVK